MMLATHPRAPGCGWEQLTRLPALANLALHEKPMEKPSNDEASEGAARKHAVARRQVDNAPAVRDLRGLMAAAECGGGLYHLHPQLVDRDAAGQASIA